MVTTALTSGLRTALRQSPLVVLLWQVSLVFGAVFAGLGATALAMTMGSSWYARSLLYDLDLTVFFALLAHEAPALKLLGASAVTLGLVYLVAWFGLHGAVVASVCGLHRRRSLLGVLQDGVRLMPAFCGIFFIAVGVTALSLGAVVIGTRWAMAWAREVGAEGAWEAALGAGVGIGALLLLFGTAVHDHARIRCVANGDGVWSSFAWAFRFVGKGGKRAYLAAFVLQSIGVVLWAIYQGVAWFISTDWMAGVIIALIWAQGFMAARMLLRVWFFAAQAQLHEGMAGNGDV